MNIINKKLVFAIAVVAIIVAAAIGVMSVYEPQQQTVLYPNMLSDITDYKGTSGTIVKQIEVAPAVDEIALSTCEPDEPDCHAKIEIECDDDYSFDLIEHEYTCTITNKGRRYDFVKVIIALDEKGTTEMTEFYTKETCVRQECNWVNEGWKEPEYDSNGTINGTVFVDNWVCEPYKVAYDCYDQKEIFVPRTCKHGKCFVVKNVGIDSQETKEVKIVIGTDIGVDGKYNIIVKGRYGYGYRDPYYNSVYGWRTLIQINNNASDENLHDFPVLVHMNNTRIDMNKLYDGTEIRFTDAGNTTELDYELEQFNSTDAYWHVKIPFIEANTDSTYIWMYYNNTSAVTNGQNIADVWSNNFSAIYHLSNVSGSTIYRDSAHYGEKNDGTITNVDILNNGTIANASGFRYTQNPDIRVPADSSLNDLRTVSLWFRPNATWTPTSPVDHTAFIAKYGGANGWYIQRIYGGVGYDGKFRVRASGTVLLLTTYSEWDSEWWYLSSTVNGSAANIYLNGTLNNYTLTGITEFENDVVDLLIGKQGADNNMAGMLDEVRLSNISRSNDWIYAQYLSQLDNEGFVIYSTNSSITNATISNQTYDVNIYEALQTTHSITIGSGVDMDIDAVLNWNSTEYTPVSTNTTPKEWYFEYSLIPPLVASEEAINFFWNFTIDYMNGTILYNQTTDTEIQNMNFGYVLEGVSGSRTAPTSNISSGFNGDGVVITTDLDSTGTLATVYNITTQFNGTAYTTTDHGNDTYSYTGTLPFVETTKSIYWNSSMTLNYDSNTIQRNSTTGSLTVSTTNLTDCSGGGYPIYQFDIYDEEDFSAVSGTFDATFRLYSSDLVSYSQFNFSYATNHTHLICIEPNTTTATISADITYDNTTLYAPRYYFLRYASATNATETINLYLLNTTYADNIQFQVVDSSGNEQGDILLNVQRYYESLGSYITVAMGITSDDGYTNIRLRPYDVYYRITASSDGTVVRTFLPTIISSAANILTIPAEVVGDYWKYHNNIAHDCELTNATKTLRCDAQATDGTQHTYSLTAYEIMSVSQEEVCSETATGSAVTLICDLSAYGHHPIKYVFVADYPNNDDVLADEMIWDTIPGQFGIYGLFFMFMFITAMTFAGLYNPTVALAFSFIGLIAGLAMGMMSISIGALVSLLLVIIIAIVRLKT